ncbi:MAG: hypothetical protein LC667_00885, partial [Thioalkalivibrio sp.]|nr:hypothetical protein [Thioalkalivibrio sp.]
MSRFVDREETETVDLGPCQCPNSPHGNDSVRIRKHLSYADQLHLADAANLSMTDALWTLFNLRVAGWNLSDERGRPVQLSRANWQNLDTDTAKAVQAAITSIG